ncbi:MAG TPA: cysteine desulfurase family protein [Candidatus Saccharimonadales bacterium]|nr:cysteine desulfurase family protein [Candidatus Saccharimonadales bacterium]
MTKNIYLDYAAATPIEPQVLKSMAPYFDQKFYNASAQYSAARQVAADLMVARAKVANWLGARPSEVIFTAGGTEANNLALHGIMQAFPDSNLIVSAIEHESVLEPAKHYSHQIAPVKVDGQVDIVKLVKLINDQTVLVSIMYANNEIGTIEPIKQIANEIKGLVKQRQKAGNSRPLYFHVDACQAANYLDLHVKGLGVDMMTINSGKIYGPKQCGALFIKASTIIEPQILGGGQEFNRRSGTENVAAVVGFAEALNLAQTGRQTEARRLKKLQDIFFEKLSQRLPTTQINGSLKQRLPNNVHLTIPGQDNETLMMRLDDHGIQCAVGSACSASNDEPSHVLKSIGLSDKAARASLRFTMGRHTTESDIIKTVDALVASCQLD